MNVPQDLDAERAVLGAMLLHVRAVEAAAAAGLQPDHFYSPTHRDVAEAVWALWEDATHVNAVTTWDRMRRQGVTEDHRALLIALEAECPAIDGSGAYAAIVAEMAERRRLMGWAGLVGEAAADLSRPLSEVREMAGSPDRSPSVVRVVA